jgi:hypothetical protein
VAGKEDIQELRADALFIVSLAEEFVEKEVSI